MPKPVKVGIGRTLSRTSQLPRWSPIVIVLGIGFGAFLFFRKR